MLLEMSDAVEEEADERGDEGGALKGTIYFLVFQHHGLSLLVGVSNYLSRCKRIQSILYVVYSVSSDRHLEVRRRLILIWMY